MRDRRISNQAIGATDHIVYLRKTQLSHNLTCILGHHEQVVGHVLRLARELGSQFRVLCRNADGTRIEMAFSHHNAAQRNEWSRRKPKLLRTQQGRDNDVATCL